MIEAMKQALEAFAYMPNEIVNQRGVQEAVASLRHAIEVYENAPPEAQTEAEKTAFAFGWFKALEFQRANNEIP